MPLPILEEAQRVAEEKARKDSEAAEMARNAAEAEAAAVGLTVEGLRTRKRLKRKADGGRVADPGDSQFFGDKADDGSVSIMAYDEAKAKEANCS